MKFTQRVGELAPEGAYHVMQKANLLEQQGRDIIHLEIGQPDFPTNEGIAKAGVDAILQGHTRYTPASGLLSLRKEIARDASLRRGIDLSPNQVVVGPGAKPALFFPTLALVQQGDEVLYPDPGFPTYRAMIEVAGATPIPVPLLEEQDFSFDLVAFDQLLSDKTKLVILNSPGNPTGGIMPQSALEHIAQKAKEYDFWIISDEIYSRMVYADSSPSIAAIEGMQERTIICDGFSKTYAMTGWRLGYGIMPEALAEKVDLLMTHSIGCTAHFVQIAGEEAIKGEQKHVDEILSIYQQRRDVLVEGLNKIKNISCRMPSGAFYAFPNISATGKSSDWLAEYLLEEADVALLSGTSFGEYGEGYLRLCFANSIENIQVALSRIEMALNKLC